MAKLHKVEGKTKKVVSYGNMFHFNFRVHKEGNNHRAAHNRYNAMAAQASASAKAW